MSNLAHYSTYYDLLSKMYTIAHFLENDPNYNKEDALEDLLKAIRILEEDKNFFEKE